jgi:NADH-quinone oxidoreductase subunit L
MAWIIQNLWLIPALPILAGAAIALAKQRHRVHAASLAISSMALSFLLSLVAFVHVLSLGHGEPLKQVVNVNWFQFGDQWLQLGWMLDPLTSVMLLMVTFVGLLIFIFSTGYMAHDENFTRFFCFLALFAGAMLTVVISNSLLLLFMGWEVMGLTSYLLIGFWYQKPSAAAAAKKAFIVTRIGDLGLFLGMAWLYSQTGTLLFYNNGSGCLEHSALTTLVTHTTLFGLTLSTAIAILIFCGAAGKSGQVPLHVWLPDAMEGPTPVSALIHAATMVAAGVFLIARVYPLMSAHAPSIALTPTIALQVVTWVGAITALFGSLVAVAQYDIKRILAYSTVSQLGYMMMGLGVGGVSVGIFHLITHAFFKSLLFLGAGSIIHGCSGEQDIRHMGGLRKYMPLTFVAYTAGMLALCGFPLFAGFWSKDEILHAAFTYSLTRVPFYMGAFGALLTAFYMTRQLFYVFAGAANRPATHQDFAHEEPAEIDYGHHAPHESPAAMTTPLAILAAFAVFLGLAGTPLWPWFQSFLEGEPATLHPAAFWAAFPLMIASSCIVFVGLGLGWLLYGRKPITNAKAPDALEQIQPHTFTILEHAFYINELYAATILRLNAFAARASDWLDRWVWNGAVQTVSYLTLGLAWFDNFFDTAIVNGGFDTGCETVSYSARILSLLQAGRIQGYLRTIGLALIVLAIFMLWGARV